MCVLPPQALRSHWSWPCGQELVGISTIGGFSFDQHRSTSGRRTSGGRVVEQIDPDGISTRYESNQKGFEPQEVYRNRTLDALVEDARGDCRQALSLYA